MNVFKDYVNDLVVYGIWLCKEKCTTSDLSMKYTLLLAITISNRYEMKVSVLTLHYYIIILSSISVYCIKVLIKVNPNLASPMAP